jgi:hypothetical protein
MTWGTLYLIDTRRELGGCFSSARLYVMERVLPSPLHSVNADVLRFFAFFSFWK